MNKMEPFPLEGLNLRITETNLKGWETYNPY